MQIEIATDQLRAWVEGSLEQFSQTEEGQHLLRQSLAMQTFRNTGVVLAADNLRSEALQVNRVKISDGIDGSGFVLNGNLELDRGEIRSAEYEATDGSFVNFSVQSSLYHELCHAADGFFTYSTSELMYKSHESPYWQAWDHAYTKVVHQKMTYEELRNAIAGEMEKKPQLKETFLASYREYPAIGDTNRFIVPHYDMKPRVCNHGAMREDPDGGARFFFDIKLPDSVKYNPSDAVCAPASSALAKPSCDKTR